MLTKSIKKEIIDCLNHALNIIEEGRRYITNRAREELSHERHDKVYEDLVEVASDPNGAKELHPKGWAETWLMFVELQDMLEVSKGNKK
jgi:hypothetical protein